MEILMYVGVVIIRMLDFLITEENLKSLPVEIYINIKQHTS